MAPKRGNYKKPMAQEALPSLELPAVRWQERCNGLLAGALNIVFGVASKLQDLCKSFLEQTLRTTWQYAFFEECFLVFCFAGPQLSKLATQHVRGLSEALGFLGLHPSALPGSIADALECAMCRSGIWGAAEELKKSKIRYLGCSIRAFRCLCLEEAANKNHVPQIGRVTNLLNNCILKLGSCAFLR